MMRLPVLAALRVDGDSLSSCAHLVYHLPRCLYEVGECCVNVMLPAFPGFPVGNHLAWSEQAELSERLVRAVNFPQLFADLVQYVGAVLRLTD
jgi:hypothetical protein